MITKWEHIDLYSKDGGLNPARKTQTPRIEYNCDKCGGIFIERSSIFFKRFDLINCEYCPKCGKSLICRANCFKGLYNNDGSLKENSGRFSTERVKNMSEEQYAFFCKQRKAASAVLQKKLNEDPILKKMHYEKIYQNSKIGYISKGQRELYECLKDDGFELEKMVEGVKCDIVNIDGKVVIEYYGDAFHLNPRKYDPDYYSTLIKMTAKEKWHFDRRRNFSLRNKGFCVIVIWESEWHNDRNAVFEKIKKYMDPNRILEKWIKTETHRKWVNNGQINKTVLNKDLNNFLTNGWNIGRVKKN
jgi:very-short-patch-repair endonuclease/predicted RNA-binding Zn-ribbon protein involved in translation (DUF1610 family)